MGNSNFVLETLMVNIPVETGLAVGQMSWEFKEVGWKCTIWNYQHVVAPKSRNCMESLAKPVLEKQIRTEHLADEGGRTTKLFFSSDCTLAEQLLGYYLTSHVSHP